METLFDQQSLATTASSSTPHTPSPRMEEPANGDYSYDSAAPAYYLEYSQQQQFSQPHQVHAAQTHPPGSQYIDVNSHPSSSAGPLYRRASFPFVHHDHPMTHYPKYPNGEAYVPEHHHARSSNPALSTQYEYEDGVKLEHASAMVVPTQIPQHGQQHQQAYYRPSSSSSSVSSVSAQPNFLPPALSTIPIMHTDDAASKETQYLRRKCFNCGTTEPPSWRRSTLNPGKIVCNKCGLYERTHNKPRPHQFGLRPGNKTRKHHHHTSSHHTQTGKLSGHSPSLSPKRHGMTVKKEPLDYSQAMRRGSIASINSGSGASDWDDHSGYSTGSSVYPHSIGMPPPPQHSLSHHSHQPQSHVPNHHGHHPYNNALSMLPPRNGTGIRLPQAPPMKIPARAGSSSPGIAPGIVPGTSNSSHIGSAAPTSSPGSMLSPSALGGSAPESPYGGPGLSPVSNLPPSYGDSRLSGPPLLPSADYYARRGSTSQIPPHYPASSHHEHHMAMMRRGSVGAIGMGSTSMGMHGNLGPSSIHEIPGWHPPAGQSVMSGASSMHVPLSDMSVTPAPAPGGHNASAHSTPRGYGNGSGDLTPSPPQQARMGPPMGVMNGTGSAGASPIGANLAPEVTSLTV